MIVATRGPAQLLRDQAGAGCGSVGRQRHGEGCRDAGREHGDGQAVVPDGVLLLVTDGGSRMLQLTRQQFTVPDRVWRELLERMS
jgi:hypothetical protein